MIQKILDKYHSTSDLNRFLIKGGGLFLLWRVFRKWMILKGQYTDFTQVVSHAYLNIANFTLKLFGINTGVDFASRKLWIEGAGEAIEIVYDCLGVNLFFVFSIFIFAYPAKSKSRLWFIPMGLVSIFLLNGFRMAALTVVVAKIPSQMDFFHHFVFQGMIYIFIFALWWWFTRLSAKNK